MCLIIASNSSIGRNIFDEAIRQNEDGLGLMYAEKEDLILRRSFNAEEIWTEYQWCMENDVQTVIHFRLATKGVINLENCHPFRLNKELAMMHNGSLNIPIYNQLMSDTWHYSKYLSHLAWHQIDWLKREIGTNKLVFMNRKGKVKILNKSLGQWNIEKTNWYSNTRVLEKLYPVTYGKSTETRYSTYSKHYQYQDRMDELYGAKVKELNPPLKTQVKLTEALAGGDVFVD